MTARGQVLAGLAALCTPALAAPAPPPPPAPPPAAPVTPEACLDNVRLDLLSDGRAIACPGGESSCLAIADAKAPLVAAARPDPAVAPSPWQLHAAAVCQGTRCLAVGPRLVAAAKAAPAAPIALTPDAVAAVVGGVAWSLPDDAPLVLRPPSKPAPGPPVAHAIGSVLVVTWHTCDEDLGCDGLATIVDSGGRTIGRPFRDGRLVALDAHHAAMLGSGRVVTTFDTDSGAQLGHVEVLPAGALDDLEVARVDDATLAVLWSIAGTPIWKLAWVSAPARKPPRIAATRSIPACAPLPPPAPPAPPPPPARPEPPEIEMQP